MPTKTHLKTTLGSADPTSSKPEVCAEIFYTTDGGTTWLKSGYPTGIPQMNEVCFVNSLTAYAVGINGTILKSENSGKNWTMLNSNTSNALYGVSFGEENIGWATGGNIIIYTTDGGGTWIEELLLSGSNILNDIYFNNSQTGYAVGSGGRIMKRK